MPKQTESQGYDITQLDTAAASEQGMRLQLLHPGTKALLPITIIVAGQDSERYRKASNAIQNARIKSMRGTRAKLTAEEIRSEQIELAARCTVSWEGLSKSGEDFPCTLENARSLYGDLGTQWIMEQVVDFSEDRENFLPS